jgi:hypothetical protein
VLTLTIHMYMYHVYNIWEIRTSLRQATSVHNSEVLTKGAIFLISQGFSHFAGLLIAGVTVKPMLT